MTHQALRGALQRRRQRNVSTSLLLPANSTTASAAATTRAARWSALAPATHPTLTSTPTPLPCPTPPQEVKCSKVTNHLTRRHQKGGSPRGTQSSPVHSRDPGYARSGYVPLDLGSGVLLLVASLTSLETLSEAFSGAILDPGTELQ